jgi:hypothetical protein
METPLLRGPVESGRLAACHFFEELEAGTR